MLVVPGSSPVDIANDRHWGRDVDDIALSHEEPGRPQRERAGADGAH